MQSLRLAQCVLAPVRTVALAMGPVLCLALRLASGAVIGLATAAGALAGTQIPADEAQRTQSLPARASAHWVWVNDFVFPHMPDGKALLVDGDSGRFLGELDTGFGSVRVVLSPDGKVIYSPETYFSRGTRGVRTDVVTLYDPVHLSVIAEIVIPPKRSSNMPMMGNAQLTDDGRFLLIYNFNPAQSITVVDTHHRTFAGEIDTPGCALAFPTGDRSFFSLCGDGSLLDVHLDDSGHARTRQRTAQMFDVARDPVTEKGVRIANVWYFVSFGGTIHPVESAAGTLRPGKSWSLLTEAQRSQQWRPGGLQQLAVHEDTQRLFSIMHQGALSTHKDPGKQVWVYDVRRGRRVATIALQNPAGSIQVTRDRHPLLFAAFIGSNVLDVYDANSGQHLRTVGDIGTTPTVLVSP